MLVPLEKSSAVLIMISSKSVSICSRFHARWANSGKMTTFYVGYPCLMPSFRECGPWYEKVCGTVTSHAINFPLADGINVAALLWLVDCGCSWSSRGSRKAVEWLRGRRRWRRRRLGDVLLGWPTATLSATRWVYHWVRSNDALPRSGSLKG